MERLCCVSFATIGRICADRRNPSATINDVFVTPTVRDALGSILVDFRLFDVYEGKGIDSNEKSLGLGLTLQSQSATLTDAEISSIIDQVVAALTDKVHAKLR